MEPILHFVFPFTMFTLGGVKLRKAIVLSCVSLLPDIDVLFGVHRSLSHSVVIWLVAVTPLYLWYLKTNNENIIDPLLLLLSGSLHILFDSFGSSTPVFWPLTSYSHMIDINLFVHVSNKVVFKPIIDVISTPTDFMSFNGFDAPIFTSESFVISLALLTPVVQQIIAKNKEFRSDLVTRVHALTDIQIQILDTKQKQEK